MNLTDNMKARVLAALRTKGISQVAMAQEMGLGKAWATKLLKKRDEGGLKTLSDEHVEKLEKLLGIKFVVVTETKKVSGVAARLSELAENSPELSSVMTELVTLCETHISTPRYFSTKEMSRLGNQIIRVAYANEDKPGKVAREVLKLVTE